MCIRDSFGAGHRRRGLGAKSDPTAGVGIVAPANASRKCAGCLLYTSDAADERSSVDLGGRRIIKKQHILVR